MNKKFIAGLASTLVLGLATSAFAFTDTTTVDAWAGKQINKLVEMKIVEGTGNNAFAPKANVTRAQFAKMIVEAKGLAKENPATPTFSDVATGAWYYGYVEAAAKAGYVIGENGKFNPDQNITREQMAKILVKAAGLTEGTTLNFTDKDAVAPWAKGFVAAVADAKLMQGFNGKFDPKAATNRAQAAVVIYNELVYEGKIVDEAPIPVGFMKVTETPTDSDIVELNGTEYDVKSTNFKIAGEYTDDARLFIEGTLVKVTMNDDDEILSMEADPQVIKGEVTGRGTVAGDNVVTVGTKDVVWVDEDDYALALENEIADFFGYNDEGMAINSNVVVLLNAEGKGYAAFAQDDTTTKGELTAVGKTSDDEFYFVVDGKKYLSDDDADFDQVTFAIYTEAGVKDTTFEKLVALMSDDVVAKLTTDSKGLVTKVTAYAKEVSGTPDFDANFTYDGKTYKNVLVIDGLNIGEKTTFDAAAPVLQLEDVRVLNGSAVITVNGATVKFADLEDELETPTDYTATATVNGSGEVVKIVITDDTVLGQISSFVENSDEKVTKVTVDGKEYTLDSKILNTNDVVKKGYLIKGTVNPDGKLANVTVTAPQAEGTSTTKFQQYKVVATTFVRGYDPAKDAANADNTDSYVTGDNNVRIQNVDTGAYYTVKVNTFVKGADDVKLATVEAGKILVFVDTDAVANDAVIDYAVISPITTTR